MKIVYEYSHLGGSEILQVRYPEIRRELREIIGGVVANKTKISREKTMPGRRLSVLHISRVPGVRDDNTH